MKFKPIYVYLIILVLAVSGLIIFTNTGTSPASSVISGESSGNQMPSDSIHKNLQTTGSPAPSKDNVSESFKRELSSLQNAVEESPNDTLKLREYADLLAAAHKQNEAIPYYVRIIKKYPRRADIMFSMSVIYFNEGDFTNSELITRKILQYDKNNLQAQYNLGAIAASQGDSEKAKLMWNKIINENPPSELAGLVRESLNKLK